MPQQLAVPPIWRCLSEYGSYPGGSPGDPSTSNRAPGSSDSPPLSMITVGVRPPSSSTIVAQAGPAPMMQSSVSISAPGGIELPSTSMA